jgi:hypothetical protein
MVFGLSPAAPNVISMTNMNFIYSLQGDFLLRNPHHPTIIAPITTNQPNQFGSPV